MKPFYVEAKLPLEVTEGDVVRLPIAFVNGTREPLSGVSMSLATKADLRFADLTGAKVNRTSFRDADISTAIGLET